MKYEDAMALAAEFGRARKRSDPEYVRKLEALAQAARELRRVDMDADVTGQRTALYLALDELDGIDRVVGRASCSCPEHRTP